MKISMPAGYAAIVAFAVLAPIEAAAQDDPEVAEEERDDPRRSSLIEEFDADGDGQLNDDERLTARRTMRDRRAESAVEADRPRRERAAGRRGRGPVRGEGLGPRPGRRGRGDDVQRPPERRRGRDPEGRPMGRPPWTNDVFDRFDADRNDSLSRSEFHALVAEVGRLLADRRGSEFDRRRGGPPILGQQFSPPRRGWGGERFDRWGRGAGRREYGPPWRRRYGRGRPDQRPRAESRNTEVNTGFQPAELDPI